MNDQTTIPGTALTAPAPTDLQALFKKPDGIRAELARIKAEADEKAKALDVTKKKDRDALKSVAFGVTKYKTAMEAAGKELNAERRKIIDAVDSERRLAWNTLEKLADDIRAPVLAWEEGEAKRINAVQTRIDDLRLTFVPTSSADLMSLADNIRLSVVDATFQEFEDEARGAQAKSLALLEDAIADAIEREAAAAELERLRAEIAKRDEEDRIAREAEAEAAAERQRIADDEARKAREAQEAAELDRQKAIKEAEDLRDQLAAAHAREKQAILDAEAAVQRTKDEADALAARLVREADEEAAAEAQAERQRVIDTKLAEETALRAALDAAARARALVDHRASIRAAISAALAAMAGRATPDAIADAIMAGEIPHVQAVL